MFTYVYIYSYTCTHTHTQRIKCGGCFFSASICCCNCRAFSLKEKWRGRVCNLIVPQCPDDQPLLSVKKPMG